MSEKGKVQSSGTVGKSRWTSWVPLSLIVRTVSVPNSQYGLCGRKATLKKKKKKRVRTVSVPKSPYGLCP